MSSIMVLMATLPARPKYHRPINHTLAMLFATLPMFGMLALAITGTHPGTFAFHFVPFALVSGTAFILDLALFFYIATRPARTEEHTWLTVYLLSISAFSGGELLQRLSATPAAALFWANLSTTGFLAGAALYLFALAYTNRTSRRFSGTTAVLLLMSMAVVFFYSFTSVIWLDTPTSMALHAWGWAHLTSSARPGLDLMALWFDGLSILATVKMFNFRHHSRNRLLRRQSLLMGIAIGFPAFAGAITDGILPGAGIVLPALANTFTALAALLLIYAAVRYRSLGISPAMFSDTILGIVQDAVVVTDDQFNVAYLNPKAEALLGIPAEGANPVSLLTSIEVEDVPTLKQAPVQGPTHGTTIGIDQIAVRHPHGSSVPVRVVSSLLQLSDASLWVIALTDITNELHTRSIIEHEVQVRTEELHRAQTDLVSSINSLEQGFILVDRNSRVELINGVASQLFQVSKTDAATKHLVEVVTSVSWDIDLADIVHKVLDSRRRKLTSAAAADGSFYQIFVTAIVAGDRELGAVIIIQDVTEQKILDRSKDEFFSIASHELRTPLTAIRGNMSMIQNYFPEVMRDESLAPLVDDTHDASVRLIEIVSDFLDSSKLEQGKMEFTIVPVAVKPLVEAVQGDLKTLLDKSHNTISTVGLDKLPPVSADEGRLRQILYNLLSNAMKYSDNATITISGEADEHKAYIRVSDTGNGIAPESQKLLFHKFQQAGESILTRDDTKGTGLGLYISRLLATNMHGNVELESSEVGKGTTFLLTLPIADGHDKALTSTHHATLAA